MAQGGIQQELNVLYTCSLSPSVSEKGTDWTVNAFTLEGDAGLDLAWRIAECEQLKCQPVALNAEALQGHFDTSNCHFCFICHYQGLSDNTLISLNWNLQMI